MIRLTGRLITSRLRRTIGYASVRGAAQATGTGLAGLLFWWITHH
jgi:heme O synthase-like polyprenyltransferase